MAVEITDEIFNNVLDEMVSSVQGLVHILNKYGIKRTTFHDYVEREQTRSEKYTRAKQEQLVYWAAEINRLSYQMEDMVRGGTVYDEVNINAAVKVLQIQIDSLKWQLSKLAPKEYGDKIEVEPIKVNITKTVNFE